MERLLAGLACALVCAAAALMLRKPNPEIALLLGVGGCAVLALAALPALGQFVEALREIAPEGTAGECLSVLLRAAVLAAVSRMGAELCRDAGQGALALKVELFGAVLVLVCALPIFTLLSALLRGLGS